MLRSTVAEETAPTINAAAVGESNSAVQSKGPADDSLSTQPHLGDNVSQSSIDKIDSRLLYDQTLDSEKEKIALFASFEVNELERIKARKMAEMEKKRKDHRFKRLPSDIPEAVDPFCEEDEE